MNAKPTVQTPSFKRAIIGFIIAPLVTGGIQAVALGSTAGLASALFSYSFAFVLGVPAFLFARRFKMTGFGAVTAGSGGLGLSSGLLILVSGGIGVYSPASLFAGLALFTAHGSIVGALFWAIAIYLPHNTRDRPL